MHSKYKDFEQDSINLIIVSNNDTIKSVDNFNV